MEKHLTLGKFTKAIVLCFNSSINSFDANLLEPLLKLLRLSPSISASLAKEDMYAGVLQKLNHKKAVVRLNLLRLVRTIMDAREGDLTSYRPSTSNVHLRNLFDAIEMLAEKDSAVLVRNLASELSKTQLEVDAETASVGSSSSQGTGRRSRSGPRSDTYATPPTLQLAFSTSSFTSHKRLAAHSPGPAYIEVASSPRRSGLSRGHDREGIPYRARSKDDQTHVACRVSGDVGTTGPGSPFSSSHSSFGMGAVKSRLPRQSAPHTRNSLSRERSQPVVTRWSRADSSLSNKENSISRSGHTPGSSSVSSTSTTTSVAAVKRHRAPSSDVKWQ